MTRSFRWKDRRSATVRVEYHAIYGAQLLRSRCFQGRQPESRAIDEPSNPDGLKLNHLPEHIQNAHRMRSESQKEKIR